MTWIGEPPGEPPKEYKHKTKHAILCDNMSFLLFTTRPQVQRRSCLIAGLLSRKSEDLDGRDLVA